MRSILFLLIVLSFVGTACNGAVAATQAPSHLPVGATPLAKDPSPTVSPAWSETVSPPGITPQETDIFADLGIYLAAPVCASPTQPQMEGPYYKSGSPERSSLLEEGVDGTRLILVGYVVDQNCNPLPNTWLDFWQADASGEYDNTGFRLRGHQYTDSQGRYYLETILPGLYASRPIEHIHVKVQPDGGEILTSQLYFPDQAVEGLTVTLEDRGDLQVGYFNFVIPR